jgi:hypothetical protein
MRVHGKEVSGKALYAARPESSHRGMVWIVPEYADAYRYLTLSYGGDRALCAPAHIPWRRGKVKKERQLLKTEVRVGRFPVQWEFCQTTEPCPWLEEYLTRAVSDNMRFSRMLEPSLAARPLPEFFRKRIRALPEVVRRAPKPCDWDY